MTDRHAPTVTSAVFRLQRSSVDLNRIMTVSRFIPYAFFFVTSAPPPVAMSLLAQATQTATEQWNWSAHGARYRESNASFRFAGLTWRPFEATNNGVPKTR